MPRDRSFPLLLLCFYLSGLAALVYETAWTRQFAFVFGTSELAVATVLAAYMGGLAFGAALASRFARRVTRPVLAYGILELGIAVAALCIPFGIAAARGLYVAIYGGHNVLPESAGATTALFYLACSFLILLVPTAMMGATLPLLARHAVRERGEIGRRIGVLYAINTAGAVSGVVLAAFWMLPTLGLDATIWAAAAINALVFVAAWALARQQEPAPADDAAEPEVEVGPRAGWILPLILASGFVSFTYEIVWVRLLGHVVGGSVHAFATMLASFLAGIALGSAAASALATTARRATAGFAIAQLGIAALSLGAFAFANQIPGVSARLIANGIDRSWADTIVCMLTLFPAALCIGASFPFAVRILAGDGAEPGSVSGRVYAFNTVGSILGSIAAGFWIIPELHFAGSMTFCAAVNLALAFACAAILPPRRFSVMALAGAAAATLFFVPVADPANVLRSTSLEGGNPLRGQAVYFGVGRSATVILTEHRSFFALRTNGLPEAGMLRPGTWPNRHPLPRWLTALPTLARPEAENLLLVGFGGGTALELVPRSIERIDVVELEPEVIEANRTVADLRWRDPLRDPRIHVHLNDARNALLLSDARYDAIVSQPSHPWSGGAAHLYTREFFELVSTRLSERGVFVQWIGTPFMDEALFRSMLATLTSVFPHVRSYEPPPGNGVLFLASGTPLEMDANVPRALASFGDDLAELGIRTPEDVTASLRLDEAGVRAMAEGAPLNRDGHNRLQNRSGRLRGNDLRDGLDALCADHDPLVHALPEGQNRAYILARLDADRSRRVAEALSDPIERELGLALAEISEEKRHAPVRRLKKILAQHPTLPAARGPYLRLRIGEVLDGRAAEEILQAPLSETEGLLVSAWRAYADEPAGAVLSELDDDLAAVPFQHPLGIDAALLRIRGRLARGDKEELAEAVRIADASLGDRPGPRALIVRAEAYATVRDHEAVLDTVQLLLTKLESESSVSQSYVRRAAQLVRATPGRGGLERLRNSLLRQLGG